MTINDMTIQPERFTHHSYSIYSYVKTRGFTLVEMSIMLVIIGLIVAGITVGQSMVRAAELRGVLTQVKNIEMALNEYDLLYDAVPGDHRDASDYWSTALNGNGNGIMDNIEVWHVFNHMRFAGLIKQNIDPLIPYTVESPIAGGNFRMMSGSDIGGYASELALRFMNGVGWEPIVTPAEAYAIDKKADDGFAITGRIGGGGH